MEKISSLIIPDMNALGNKYMKADRLMPARMKMVSGDPIIIFIKPETVNVFAKRGIPVIFANSANILVMRQRLSDAQQADKDLFEELYKEDKIVIEN